MNFGSGTRCTVTAASFLWAALATTVTAQTFSAQEPDPGWSDVQPAAALIDPAIPSKELALSAGPADEGRARTARTSLAGNRQVPYRGNRRTSGGSPSQPLRCHGRGLPGDFRNGRRKGTPVRALHHGGERPPSQGGRRGPHHGATCISRVCPVQRDYARESR